MQKKSLTVRLSSDARALLYMTSLKLGISQTAAMELSVRRFASDNGCKLLMELGSYR